MRAASATCRGSSADALGDGGLPRELEGREGAAGVAARLAHDRGGDVGRDLRAELGGAAGDDGRHLLVRQRLELDHGAAGDEGGVDLEVGVLGRRPDQRHEPALDPGQERVLLALVEAVDLVEEEDRA